MRVIVTVAGHDVLGLAYSHPRDELKQLDLTDAAATERVFSEVKPDWVIHCAAERRPDVAEKDPEGARKVRHLSANATRSLNVSVPENLAKLSKALKFKLVYISTGESLAPLLRELRRTDSERALCPDYVFDGTSPPYTPSAIRGVLLVPLDACASSILAPAYHRLPPLPQRRPPARLGGPAEEQERVKNVIAVRAWKSFTVWRWRDEMRGETELQIVQERGGRERVATLFYLRGCCLDGS
ncbi:hypothetical protein NUW54_g10226 [Trametes sanguinea]|uniref:Uncharacterized protein n=1 Tax=Trametes sanguinea TaxID=158606 RepID=A0ACC1P1Q2_9APHY|nr:hypothetical protein NUW54_g10226 [Trametes sanguinea]